MMNLSYRGGQRTSKRTSVHTMLSVTHRRLYKKLIPILKVMHGDMKIIFSRIYEEPGTDMGNFWLLFLEMSDPKY